MDLYSTVFNDKLETVTTIFLLLFFKISNSSSVKTFFSNFFKFLLSPKVFDPLQKFFNTLK